MLTIWKNVEKFVSIFFLTCTPRSVIPAQASISVYSGHLITHLLYPINERLYRAVYSRIMIL